MIQKKQGEGESVDHINLIQRNDAKTPGIKQMHAGSLIQSQTRFVLTRLNFIPWDVWEFVLHASIQINILYFTGSNCMSNNGL